MSARVVAFIALGLPVFAGIIYLWLGGAPPDYSVTNAAAFALVAVALLLPPINVSVRTRRVALVLMLALLFVPLATGPYLNGIARWLPLGPFQLHAGSLLLPSLTVLAARERDYAPPIFLTALLAAFVQPDAATGYAVMFAAVGLYIATADWRMIPVVAVSFLASLIAGFRGELPAQPFVERVLIQLAFDAPLIGLALLLALLGGFFTIVHALHAPKRERHALAGALFGFSLAALVSNYPSVLIGYGAAPIIGFGAALSLARHTPSG